MNVTNVQRPLQRKYVEPLSSKEKIFFQILKIVVRSTISSPFYVSYLLLQSKRIILSEYEKPEPTNQSSNMFTKIVNGVSTSINNLNFFKHFYSIQDDKTDVDHLQGIDLSMLQLLANEQNGAAWFGFGLLWRIIKNSRYRWKFLSCGSAYCIFDNILSLCDDTQNIKGEHLDASTWLASPFEYIFINYLFYNENFANDDENCTLFSEYRTKWLQIGCGLSFLECIGGRLFCGYWRGEFITPENNWLDKQILNFIGLGLYKIVTYPLNTMKNYAFAIDPGDGNLDVNKQRDHAFDQVVGDDNDYSQLYAGLPMYLTQFCVYQGANLICDLMLYWYKKKYKTRELIGIGDESDELQRLICNICWENERDHVFVECGHTICAQCKDRVNACPVCRQPIVNCRRIFL